MIVLRSRIIDLRRQEIEQQGIGKKDECFFFFFFSFQNLSLHIWLQPYGTFTIIPYDQRNTAHDILLHLSNQCHMNLVESKSSNIHMLFDLVKLWLFFGSISCRGWIHCTCTSASSTLLSPTFKYTSAELLFYSSSKF